MFVACVLSLYIIQYILCWRVFYLVLLVFLLCFRKKNEKKSSSKSSRLFPFKTDISLPLSSIYLYILLKELHACICFVPLDRLQTTCLLLFILFSFDFCQSFVLILHVNKILFNCKNNCCNDFHKNISQSACILKQQMTISCVFCNEM